jgi:hypothetical protein
MATTEAGGKTRNNRNNKNGDENQGGNKSKVMRLDRVERLNLTLSAGAVAASLALTTPHFTASLAVGAALEAANFRALRDTGKRLVSGELVAAGPRVGIFGARFLLLAGAIVLSVSLGANPIALLIGLSIVVPAVIIDAWRHRPVIQDCEPVPVPPPDDPSWDDWNVWRVQGVDSPSPIDEVESSEVEEG